MAQAKPRLVGLNHIALRRSHKDDTGRVVMAFIDMGDKFIALSRGRHQKPDRDRHFGLAVDDRSAVRDLAVNAGAELPEGDFLDFLDPGQPRRGGGIR